jgi:penicillin-insensitive murein endopeptidase
MRPLLCVFAALLAGQAWAAAAVSNPWAEVSAPSAESARVIGGYTGGCVGGAVSLLGDEGDFHLMRKSRRRYFAHPRMRTFIKDLAAHVTEKGYGKLLVGDQGQARGGPTTTGHASHQTGLDGDFWFWLDSPATERELGPRDEENLSAISMLNQSRTGVDPARFKSKHVEVLHYAATRPGVERIFVHPGIKKALCEMTGEAPWLNRVRPWWGHHYHFHVRLACPQGDGDCKAQAPPPKTAGCAKELDWWFETMERARKQPSQPSKLTPAERMARKLAKVPAKCGEVLRN